VAAEALETVEIIVSRDDDVEADFLVDVEDDDGQMVAEVGHVVAEDGQIMSEGGQIVGDDIFILIESV
jgi:hypothetical protein